MPRPQIPNINSRYLGSGKLPYSMALRVYYQKSLLEEPDVSYESLLVEDSQKLYLDSFRLFYMYLFSVMIFLCLMIFLCDP